MSGPRLRFHFHPTEPLRLGDARLALFGALWVRAIGGRLVASNENRSALEDLEWLGIEPDAMVSRPKSERYDDVFSSLVDNGKAYPCFCGTTEGREMDLYPGSWPEERRYDGRCRGLSPKDRKTLQRSRQPGIRLRASGSTPDFDYLLCDAQEGPRVFFSRVVDEDNARCTHSMVPRSKARSLDLRAQIRAALELESPENFILEPWDCEAALLPVHELRNEGFLPQALLLAMVRSCWSSDSGDLEVMAARFKIEELAPSKEGPTTKEDIRAINASTLESLDESVLIGKLVSHLMLRGYPIAERDRPWQERFLRATKNNLQTLGDAEELANHLLQDSSEFDRSSLRRLPGTELNALLDQFESLMGELDEDSSGAWRRLIHKFRQEVPAPGRALSHIRVIMTGQPRGPSLSSVLWLLGTEECKERLGKARSLHG